MRLGNCERCGKLFQRMSSPLCPECREHEDGVLRKAKDLLYREPNLGIMELAERLGEPLEQVEKLMRDGRLVLKRSSGVELRCELCGKPVAEGKRCPACALRIRRIADQIAMEKKASRHRMHSLGTIKMREGEEDGGG